jgi:raffinose synthase
MTNDLSNFDQFILGSEPKLEPREFTTVGEALVLSGSADITQVLLKHAPQRILVLARRSPWWFEPYHISNITEAPRETAAMIYQLSEQLFGVVLTLAAGNKRAYLQGDDKGMRLFVVGPRDGAAVPLVIHALGTTVDQAMTRALAAAHDVLGTFKFVSEKKTPTWCDTLGWCTWDAFYQEVSHDNVVRGLTSLKKAGIEPKFMILDDGWLDSDGDQLLSFDAHPKKFPNGLAPLIKQCREEFGIQKFGVWHTLQGYWAGVHPQGPLSKKYRVLDAIDTHFHGSNWRAHHGIKRGLVHPDDIGRFFTDWYANLKQQGVDFTKVDNHASLESFGDEAVTHVNPTRAALDYQRALQAAAVKHFDTQLLHCMCNSTEHLYRLAVTNSWRNSNDFYPRQPGSHGFHVQTNAKNALLASRIAQCDWDMFHSHHNAANAHAAARVISGGPIYISDAPGKHNAELLKKLTLSGSRTVQGSGGIVTDDRIFVDCLAKPRLLKVKRVEQGYSLLGIFHTHWVGERSGEQAINQAAPITDSWTTTDALDATGLILAWSAFAKKFQWIDSSQTNAIMLEPMQAELITLIPVIDGLAVVGLTDKLDPRMGVESISKKPDGSTVVVLRDGGDFTYYSTKTGVVTQTLDPGKPHTVTITT